MPLYHCEECHHEWEGDDICDWCGSPGYILEKETSFERFCNEITNDKTRKRLFKEMKKRYKDGQSNNNT